MQDFWFYIQLGFQHVLDPNAYDHILFLVALAAPFTFRKWKMAVVLATVFTITHCISLALSAYGIFTPEVTWIEFLIPVTIITLAILNLFRAQTEFKKLTVHLLATAFFGLVHGFGFSNYFNLIMAEEPDKLVPLLGFACGIEVSQVIIILLVLLLNSVVQLFKPKPGLFARVISIIVALITIPLLIKTFPL